MSNNMNNTLHVIENGEEEMGVFGGVIMLIYVNLC